jgi:hypothetical protein
LSNPADGTTKSFMQPRITKRGIAATKKDGTTDYTDFTDLFNHELSALGEI